MEADLFSVLVIVFLAVLGLYCYLLAEYTEERLLIRRDIRPEDGFPQGLLGLEYVFEARVLLGSKLGRGVDLSRAGWAGA